MAEPQKTYPKNITLGIIIAILGFFILVLGMLAPVRWGLLSWVGVLLLACGVLFIVYQYFSVSYCEIYNKQ